MFDRNTLILYLVGAISLNLTPGADTIYVLTRSLGQGRKAGIVSALGISTGCLVHIAAASLGLSALLATSALAYDLVKYIGAAYLAYLGWKMLRSGGGLDAIRDLPEARLGQIYRQGMLTNVLNPKVALFFLAFLPQFVNPARGSAALQFGILGLLFDVTGTLWIVFLALISGVIGDWLKRHPRFIRFQRRATGILFLGLAARLALTRRTA